MVQDKTLVCADCQQEFAFTAGEQDFYVSKGLPEPVYCTICRGRHEARKQDLAKWGRKS